MNILMVSILVSSMILTSPQFLSHYSSSRPYLVASKGDRVKRDLLKLFDLCKSERYAEAAGYFVYRGPDKKREWKDLYRSSDSTERRMVEASCRDIRLLLQSESYSFVRFTEQRQKEGRWYVWEMLFRKGSDSGNIYFALLDVKGRYAVGDIDGHLAFLRTVGR